VASLILFRKQKNLDLFLETFLSLSTRLDCFVNKKDRGGEMTESVRARISDSLETATRTGKIVASYMLANMSTLPFETAATIARKTGVSEPMIGRYCRGIGYKSFKGLKADLKDDIGARPWLIGDRLKEFQRLSLRGKDQVARSLDLEIAGLVKVYEFVHTAEWERAVRRLATVETLFVAGFQTERGVAQIFAHQMQYLRPGVQLVDMASGNFADVLLGDPKSCALVMFEMRRHSRLSFLLAREARNIGMPTTLITDSYCHWARDVVDEVFAVPTDLNLFWDSNALLLNLINRLIGSVFTELGPEVEDRMNAVAALYSKFTGYVDDLAGPQN
jgi:DNA-binding MurR/RpiR family transcriptional regulator